MGDGGYTPDLVPRLCHIVRWPEFSGYGFNLHAEKGKAGQFIGKVDEGSPAEAAGLKAGDRIVEVNGTNIGNENHQQVVGRIKAGGDETRLLVVDPQTDHHYKEEKKVVRGDLPEVKFMTAERDDNETSPQHVDPPATAVVQNTVDGEEYNANNGSTDPEPQVLTEDTTTVAAAATPPLSEEHAPRLCHLCKWPDFDGYGFNLHAEKDKPGQYIGLVDPNSPAETGGLREGDRIIEVNGDNIEASNHTVVIAKIKSGGDRTSMLVVDKAADDYFKSRGQTVSSGMDGVVVISTPPRLAVEGVTAAVQAVATHAAAPVTPAVTSGLWGSAGELTTDLDYDGPPSPPPPPPPPELEQWVEGEGLTDFPSPTLDLDLEETKENVTAVVTQKVESVQEQTSDFVQNGAEVVTRGAAAVGAEEEVASGVAAVAMVTQGDVGTVLTSSTHQQQEEVVVGGGGGAEYNPYEEVDVSAAPATITATTTAVSYQEELGTTTNGINGGAVVESQAEAAKVSEPPQAVIHTTTTTTTSYGGGDDLNLNLSAAEMKERLKSRKKQDPRASKTSFESKYKMFEKM